LIVSSSSTFLSLLLSQVQQLCLIEQNLCRELNKRELTDLGWTKKKNGNEARAVKAIITRFNEFSRWVAFEVLKGPTPDERARVIEKFIRICEVIGLFFFFFLTLGRSYLFSVCAFRNASRKTT